MAERNSRNNMLTEAAGLTITLEPTTLDVRSRTTVLQPPSEAALLTIAALGSPQEEDFDALGRLFSDRRPDMTPDHPEYAAQHIASQKNNADIWHEKRALAIAHPERYLAQEALINGRNVAGYIVGEAPPDDIYTWFTGIAVARKYADLGVGGFLLDKGLDWAQHLKRPRPVRVEIATGNQRSRFLAESRGFNLVETVAPTPTRPVSFNVLELPLPLLSQRLL